MKKQNEEREDIEYSQSHAVLEIITTLNRETSRFPKIREFIFDYFGDCWTSETKKDYNREIIQSERQRILQMIEDKKEVYGELIKRDGLREDIKLRKLHQMVTCEELINEIK